MKQTWKQWKKKRLFFLLFIIGTIFFALGCLYIAILGKESKEIIATSLKNFFDYIQSDHLNYSKALTSSLINNVFANFLIWVIGISIIGIPIVIGLFAFKSFMLGFSYVSIIYYYGIPGIFIGAIYIFPHIINLFITFLLVYYSIRFSIMLFNYLFRKKEGNHRSIVKRYIRILIFSMLILVLSSVIEVYLLPVLFRVFSMK